MRAPIRFLQILQARTALPPSGSMILTFGGAALTFGVSALTFQPA